MPESPDPDGSPVDLALPGHLTPERQVQRLREMIAVTGKPSGTTPQQDVGTGQPVRVPWWSDHT
jgi:hypothetical protein